MPILTLSVPQCGGVARCHTPIASSAPRARIVSQFLTLPHCNARSELRRTISCCCLPVPNNGYYAIRDHQTVEFCVERMCEALGVDDETQLQNEEVTVSGELDRLEFGSEGFRSKRASSDCCDVLLQVGRQCWLWRGIGR